MPNKFEIHKQARDMATNKTAYQIARELIKAKEEIKRLKGEQDNQPNKSKEFFHG